LPLHLEHLASPAPLAAVIILATGCATLALLLLRARRRIEELTLVDTLTGLGNRRLMERELPRELARARRAQRWLYVGVADVDRLEPYNRAFGRPAGHALLAGIGSILRSSLRRAGDHAFRSGGDQFTFAFCVEHKVDGPAMTERIRARVCQLDRRHAGNPPHGMVTVSIGLVPIEPGEEATVTEVLDRAAEALALARKEGRNRVVGLSVEGERIRTADGIALTPLPTPAFDAARVPAGSRDPEGRLR
jgi:diguanylate cyclase (GGDEF)-like protein